MQKAVSQPCENEWGSSGPPPCAAERKPQVSVLPNERSTIPTRRPARFRTCLPDFLTPDADAPRCNPIHPRTDSRHPLTFCPETQHPSPSSPRQPGWPPAGRRAVLVTTPAPLWNSRVATAWGPTGRVSRAGGLCFPSGLPTRVDGSGHVARWGKLHQSKVKKEVGLSRDDDLSRPSCYLYRRAPPTAAGVAR